jgi:hypothetical protein
LPRPAKFARPSPGLPFCEDPYVDAVGVGSNDKEPSSEVRRSDGGSGDHVPRPHVPEVVKVSEDASEAAPGERGDVFDEDDARADFADEARVLPPEAGPLAFDAGAFAGKADVLAGESAAHDVDGGKISSCADVVMAVCLGPVPREHAPAEFIDLDLPNGAGPEHALEGELEAADAGEERADRGFLHLREGDAKDGLSHGAPPSTSTPARGRESRRGRQQRAGERSRRRRRA